MFVQSEFPVLLQHDLVYEFGLRFVLFYLIQIEQSDPFVVILDLSFLSTKLLLPGDQLGHQLRQTQTLPVPQG